jgi:hypothetical protein
LNRPDAGRGAGRGGVFDGAALSAHPPYHG